MKRLLAQTALLLAVMAGLGSCHDETDDPDTPAPDTTSVATRTVLVYMVAENSLASEVSRDIGEMLSGASSMNDGDQLVIYLDDLGLPRIYCVTNQTTARSLAGLTPEYSFGSERNSATGETLDEVMRYTVTLHQAGSYGVVMWSHASGWTPYTSTDAAQSPSRTLLKSFGIDNGKNSSSNSGTQLNVDDMADVLASYPGIDFVFFDACFMQTVEVAYALRNAVSYVMGSPAEIPGTGAPYDKVMAPMFAQPLDVDGIVRNYYNYYYANSDIYGALVSAVDCSAMDSLAAVTDSLLSLSKYDIATVRAVDYSGVLNYFDYDSWHYMNTSIPDSYDANGFMSKLLTADDYRTWRKAFDKAVVHSYATDWYFCEYEYLKTKAYRRYIDTSQYGGMSMFVPTSKYAGTTMYDNYKQTEWGARIPW